MRLDAVGLLERAFEVLALDLLQVMLQVEAGRRQLADNRRCSAAVSERRDWPARANRLGERCQLHAPALLQGDGALHDVLQLAHVARPLIRIERRHGFRRKALNGLPHLARQLDQEVLGHERHVARALAKRRQLDGNHVEAVEEVLTELPFCDKHRQVAIGRRDDADVGGHLLGAAHPPELPLLQHAQEFDLHRRRHLADLVEKYRAALGHLDEALLVGVGAGEGALHMAEELRLEKRLGHGAAIDRHERLALPERQRVDGLGNKLLAGAGLARDEDGAVRAAHGLDQPEHVQHRRAPADDAGKALLHGRPPQHRVLVLQPPCLQQLPHLHRHQVDVSERLLEERLGAQLARMLPVVGVARPVRGHHQDDGVGRGVADDLQELQAVETGHADVGQDDVHELARDDVARGHAVLGNQDLEAVTLEQYAQPLAHRLLVVYDENSRHSVPGSSNQKKPRRKKGILSLLRAFVSWWSLFLSHSPARAKRTVNVVPRPGADCTSMRPRLSVTIR